MQRINLKIDLTKLHSVTQFQKGKSGPVECIIIPIEENYLFRGKSGIYLDMTAFEIKERKENQTNLIKQSLPKEVYETLTEDEKRALPILGNANVMNIQGQKPPVPLEETDDLPY
jgi:hypothetical protein